MDISESTPGTIILTQGSKVAVLPDVYVSIVVEARYIDPRTGREAEDFSAPYYTQTRHIITTEWKEAK